MAYKGFYIEECVGNNVFSYTKRKNKTIYVPPIKEVGITIKEIEEALQLSGKVAFAEYDDDKGEEINVEGLQYFLHFEKDAKDIYVFDNHNHAFYFIARSKQWGKYMVHFDQHKDMRVPEYDFRKGEKALIQRYGLLERDELLTRYTNEYLNVGNFIVPLLQENYIEDLLIVDSSYRLERVADFIQNKKDLILDIDLDFFSSDMDYIEEAKKIEAICKCYEKASLVTICTSPYFIEFSRAKNYIKKILQSCGYVYT